jgi:hypothetical protein
MTADGPHTRSVVKAPTHIQTYRPLTYARSIRAQARARTARALRWMASAYMMIGAGLAMLLAFDQIGFIAGGPMLKWVMLTWMLLFLFHLVPTLLTQLYHASSSRDLWQRAEVAQGIVLDVTENTDKTVSVTYRYTTEDGQDLTHTAQIARPRLEEAIESQRTDPNAPIQGALIQVAYDSAYPSAHLVPAFREDLFEAVRQDRRPWLDTSHGISSPPSLGAPETLVLHPSTDAKGPWWQRSNTPSGGARLIVSEEGLTMTGQSDEPARVRWDRPFAVSLSAWIASTDTVDLHVRIRQRGLPATAPSVAFTVRLPQQIVDRRIPLKQENLPILDPSEFESLWSAMRHFAQIHNDPLDDRLDIGQRERPDQSERTQTETVEAVHTVASR